jgi:hypothetical protein
MDTSDSPFFAIPPDRLACSIRNVASMVQHTQKWRRSVLWSVVGHWTGHGSTVSNELCRYAGLNPNSILPRVDTL